MSYQVTGYLVSPCSGSLRLPWREAVTYAGFLAGYRLSKRLRYP